MVHCMFTAKNTRDMRDSLTVTLRLQTRQQSESLRMRLTDLCY